MQAITPTMILVLAGLELTTNDVHSRLTRSMSGADGRPSTLETAVQLETMRFTGSDVFTSDPGSMLPTITFQSEKRQKDLEAPL